MVSKPGPPSSVSAPPPPFRTSSPPRPVEDVDGGIALQGVVESAADEVLDARERVTGGISARPSSCHKIDGNARGGTSIRGRVRARSPVQHVGARAAFKNVIGFVAVERVVAAEPEHDVAKAIAAQDLGGVVAGRGAHELLDDSGDVARAARVVSGQRELAQRQAGEGRLILRAQRYARGVQD